MSMNAWLAPMGVWKSTANGVIMNRESDLGVMGAVNVWLFIDENPGSINDGYFAEYPPPGPNTTADNNWADYPATYHGGAGGITFCDGHAQIKKWTDPVVLNMKLTSPGEMAATPLNGDLAWLQNLGTRGN